MKILVSEVSCWTLSFSVFLCCAQSTLSPLRVSCDSIWFLSLTSFLSGRSIIVKIVTDWYTFHYNKTRLNIESYWSHLPFVFFLIISFINVLMYMYNNNEGFLLWNKDAPFVTAWCKNVNFWILIIILLPFSKLLTKPDFAILSRDF